MTALASATDLRRKLASVEAEKMAAEAKARALADAEKHAFLERLTKPSGLSEEQAMEKASHIVNRAVEAGMTSVQVLRFPNTLCKDDGRAIDEGESTWPSTLTGVPRELWDFYERRLKPLGYHMTYEIADRPNGFRGDVAVYLRWE
jgi:hypothetical protein